MELYGSKYHVCVCFGNSSNPDLARAIYAQNKQIAILVDLGFLEPEQSDYCSFLQKSLESIRLQVYPEHKSAAKIVLLNKMPIDHRLAKAVWICSRQKCSLLTTIDRDSLETNFYERSECLRLSKNQEMIRLFNLFIEKNRFFHVADEFDAYSRLGSIVDLEETRKNKVDRKTIDLWSRFQCLVQNLIFGSLTKSNSIRMPNDDYVFDLLDNSNFENLRSSKIGFVIVSGSPQLIWSEVNNRFRNIRFHSLNDCVLFMVDQTNHFSHYISSLIRTKQEIPADILTISILCYLNFQAVHKKHVLIISDDGRSLFALKRLIGLINPRFLIVRSDEEIEVLRKIENVYEMKVI